MRWTFQLTDAPAHLWGAYVAAQVDALASWNALVMSDAGGQWPPVSSFAYREEPWTWRDAGELVRAGAGDCKSLVAYAIAHAALTLGVQWNAAILEAPPSPDGTIDFHVVAIDHAGLIRDVSRLCGM